MYCSQNATKLPQADLNPENKSKNDTSNLEELVEALLPLWPGGNLGFVGIDHFPVKLTTSSIDINLVESEPTLSLPGVSSDPENEDDRNSEPSLEELLSGGELTALLWWGNGVEESGNQDEEAKGKTDPRSSDTKDGLVWNLIKSAAVVSPCASESDVSKNDGSPGEEGSKTGKTEEPGEDDLSTASLLDISQSTANKEKSDGWERTTRFVNIGEDLWSISFLGEGGKSSGSTINARDTNGHDWNHDDAVDEVIKTNETSIKGSNDEGRGSVTVCASLLEETLVVGWDEKTDQTETKDKEESDTPEDLLDRTWQSLDWVLGLSGSKTNKFGSGEGESSGNEHSAETLESVLERTRIVPRTCSPIFAIDTSGWATSADEDDGSDHEDDYWRS